MAIVYGTKSGETIDAADGVTDQADTIYGYDGSDHIFGLGGNDWILGGMGSDVIDGGSGIDTVLYSDSPEGIVITEAGFCLGGTAQGDTLISIENIYGSRYHDHISGTVGNNVLAGLQGNDILWGWGGDDVLSGGDGEDYLKGGAGADAMYGGAGQDTLFYDTSPAGVTVLLYAHSGSGGDAQGDTFWDIESVIGSPYADNLLGDDLGNSLNGSEGNDILKGLGGNDRLLGGDGDDRLYGGDSHDLLIGGAGRDELYGGSGADTFRWGFTDETGLTPATADVVMDFNPHDGDRIDVRFIDANVYEAGDQAFVFIGSAAFSGTPGEINYIHSGGDTLIQLQTGTSPDVEAVIRLDGIHTPEASWFFL